MATPSLVGEKINDRIKEVDEFDLPLNRFSQKSRE